MKKALCFLIGIPIVAFMSLAPGYAEEDMKKASLPSVNTSLSNIPQVQNQNAGQPSGAPTKGGYEAGKFALTVGNTSAGWIQSVEGGHATAEAVGEKNPTPSSYVSTTQLHKISAVDQDSLRQKFGTPEVGDEEKSSVPWEKHKNSEGDTPTLEFKAAEPKALKAELMFDSFEEKAAPVVGAPALMPAAETPNNPLRARAPASEASAISSPRTMVSSKAMFHQGDVEGDNEPATKYTMFLPNGTPVRATDNIEMSEVSKSMNKTEAKSETKKNEDEK